MSLNVFLTLVVVASCWIATRGADDRFRAQFSAAEVPA